jgi:tetratricopeptide (TPR) repeat protein
LKWQVLIPLFVVGCAHRSPAPLVTTRVDMEPMHFQARPDGKVELIDAESIFRAAVEAFGAGRNAEAARLFDRVSDEFPESRFYGPSLYNAALAFERQKAFAVALERYRTLSETRVESRDALDALFRRGALQSQLGDHQRSAETFGVALERKDLSLSDRIEARARRAESQFQLKDLDGAERTLRGLVADYRAHEAEERLDTDYFRAMGAYYLGEIAHARYRLLPVRLPEKQLEEDFELKGRMLLLAQARYVETMRVNHPSWATAAGYQIASLYRELYEDLVGAPVPVRLTGEAKEVYLEEVRKKVRPLLEKALAFHEKNLLMAERVGESNEWVRRSTAELEQLRKALASTGRAEKLSPLPAAPPLPKPQEDRRPQTLL